MADSAFVSRKLKFIANLVGRSAFRPMLGEQSHPVLVAPTEMAVTFIGHSSFFIQMGGLNLLIDPVFATWLVLLRRLRRPGAAIKQLPPIDAVLLTHAHMDHLNLPSLRKIIRHTRRLRGKAPAAVVPWGVEDLVATLGFEQQAVKGIPMIEIETFQAKQVIHPDR